MKKKILAIILAMVMMMCCFSACDLLSTDSERDMAQSVAEVDISRSEDFQEGGEYYDYRDVIQPMSITKRELVAYFVDSGYSFISQGMSYADTFARLMNGMVNYKVILQYSMVYFFEESKDENSEYFGVYSVGDYKAYVGDATGEELLIKTLEYFLNKDVDKTEYTDSQGNTVSYTRYDKAVYNVKRSVNSAIDSQENRYIAAADNAASSSDAETRTTPAGIDTENEDYYDPDYDIYTGLNALSACGSYEKVSGGTTTTRRKAFNSFLNMLSNNYLVERDELATATSTEPGKGVTALKYFRSELLTQLQSVLSEKLSDSFEYKAASAISADYLSERYDSRFATQKEIYDSDVSSFESDIGSLSDSSFVLYSPEGATADDGTKYGFVYNILLPFSSTQSYRLTALQSNNGLSQTQYYAERAKLLERVQGQDQRDSWFNGTTDYSFSARESGLTAYNNGNNSDYLFFENSMTKSEGEYAQYEALEKYYGYYPYNGTATYNPERNEYALTPNKLNITSFLTEMENYMNWALEKDGYANRASAMTGSVSLNGKNFTLSGGRTDTYGTDLLGADGKIDYSRFVYYVGQVGGIQNSSANNLFVNNNAAYTALSAFNELQFAYSTDPGSLNTYLGYSISRYSTSYVGEFEYAAKLAISLGTGTYTVCPSDYGWHIIYCTYAFNQGSVYEVDWERYVTDGLIDEDKLTENSFEYYFYQSIKSNLVSSYQNVLNGKIANQYNRDACVTIHENRYSDYTSLQNTMNTSSDSSAS